MFTYIPECIKDYIPTWINSTLQAHTNLSPPVSPRHCRPPGSEDWSTRIDSRQEPEDTVQNTLYTTHFTQKNCKCNILDTCPTIQSGGGPPALKIVQNCLAATSTIYPKSTFSSIVKLKHPTSTTHPTPHTHVRQFCPVLREGFPPKPTCYTVHYSLTASPIVHSLPDCPGWSCQEWGVGQAEVLGQGQAGSLSHFPLSLYNTHSTSLALAITFFYLQCKC